MSGFRQYLPGWMLCGAVFTLPFGHILANNIFLIGFFVTTFLFNPGEHFKTLSKNKWWVLLFASLFFIHCLSLLVHGSERMTFKLIERNLPVLLIPVAMLSFERWKTKTFNIVLLSLIGSCLLTALICWGMALNSLVAEGRPWQDFFLVYYSYHNLAAFVGIQGNYLALYALVAVFAVVVLYERKSVITNRWYAWLLVIFLTLFLFHLSIRIVLVAYIFMAVSYTAYKVYALRSVIPVFVLITGFAVSILLVKFPFFFLHYRIFGQTIELKKTADNDDKKSEGGAGISIKEKRLDRWKAAWSVAEKHLLVGRGAGKDQLLLDEAYKANKLYIAYFYSYNTHNQFLQFLLTNGVLGLILFCTCLATIFFLGIKQRNWFAVSFIMVFVLFSLTESSLRRNKGVVFYSLFAGIFALQLLEKQGKNEDETVYL